MDLIDKLQADAMTKDRTRDLEDAYASKVKADDEFVRQLRLAFEGRRIRFCVGNMSTWHPGRVIRVNDSGEIVVENLRTGSIRNLDGRNALGLYSEEAQIILVTDAGGEG